MINTGINKTSGALHNNPNALQAQIQAKSQGQIPSSKLTLQQQQMLRQRQQQQQQQNQQQQQHQLAQQVQGRPNSQNYNFASTSGAILKKYAKYPPSLTFHIYESHYRFNNSQDSNIIPKTSPMIKSFLDHVMKEEIPSELSELIKDFAIRSYDGCIILQVYDHRNMVPSSTPPTAGTNNTSESAGKNTTQSNASPDVSGTTTGSTNSTQSTSKEESDTSNNTSSAPTNASSAGLKPKTYRTLLKPTQLSLYYDLLYHTDSALTKFTDPLSLQMESEILTLTNRKLDLSVPLNPYLCEDYLKPEVEYPRKEWDEKTQDWKLVYSHREAVENPPRKLHQDELVLHKSSDYEELMFLLSNKYIRSDDNSDKKLVVVGSNSVVPSSTTSNDKNGKEGTVGPDGKPKKLDAKSNGSSSTVAGANVVNYNSTNSNPTSGQFMRLRYIEEIRKRRESQKVQQETAAAQATNNGANSLGNMPTMNNSINTNAMTENKSTFAMKDGTIQRPSSQPPAQSTPQQRQQQLMADKAQALRARQLQAQQHARQLQQQQQQQQQQQHQQQQQLQQQANKRQKKDLTPSQQPQQPYNSVSSTPQMGMSQPGSNMGTPVMNGNVPTPQQRFQQVQQQQALSQQPQSQPGSAQPPQAQIRNPSGSSQGQPQSQPSQNQLQQQQIFQNTLTPQEQQTFKQLQSRMNAFAMMGNSGIAPNRAQLTQQQQQQAIQQAKLIQQQLLQKYPLYFQRLRQFQLIQQQRQQIQQQPQGQAQQQAGNIPGTAQNQSFNQQHQNVGGKTVPGGMNPQQQQLINQQMRQQMANNMNEQDKKKRGYKKK